MWEQIEQRNKDIYEKRRGWRAYKREEEKGIEWYMMGEEDKERQKERNKGINNGRGG